MTESTSLPAARPRRILTQIAPVTWEHPADRAALQSLRSVPGFDKAVNLLDHFVEPGHGAQRLQRSAIGGVLPGHRRDLGENAARARRGKAGGLGHVTPLLLMT